MDNKARNLPKKKKLADSSFDLREEQLRRELKNASGVDRKRVKRELKNALRRKRRLKDKARQLLNNTDLVEVLLMRQAEKAEPSSQEGGAKRDIDGRKTRSRMLKKAGSET